MSNYVVDSENVQFERIKARVDVLIDDTGDVSDPITDCYGEGEDRPHITYRKSSRYTLGTDALDEDEIQELNERGLRGEIFCLPVYAYVHSNVSLRAGTSNPFGCPWDSGMSGIVYVTQEFAEKSWPSLTGAALRKAVHEFLVSIVDEYSSYLSGEVYGFQVFLQRGDDEEEVDSCWGFIGDHKYALEEGKSVALWHAKREWELRQTTWRKQLKEARERRFWEERDIVTA